jgi:spermidine/putrescine transport system permease protein
VAESETGKASSATPAVSVRFGERLSRSGQWLRAALTSGPAVLWLMGLLLLPLLGIVLTSFLSRGDDAQLTLPFTLENYRRLAGFGLLGFDPLYPVVLLRSLLLGAGTALLCVLAALPLAFFIARLPGRWKHLALTLVVIPFWTNLLIRTYAWQILLAPESFLSGLARWAGLLSAEGGLYPGVFAVALGMTCDFLPFMVLPLYTSVEKLDWTLAEAAADLGANRWQVFRHALLPQIRPGLTAGVILVFLPATGQFVIPDLLGGAKTAMLGNVIQQQFVQSRDWPFGSALAVTALTLVLAGLWVHARRVRSPAPEEIL